MNQYASEIWLIHVAATLFLVGLIWTIQVVHYPLFAEVGAEQFHRYEQRHTQLITWIVGPMMLVEAITCGALFLIRPPFLSVAGMTFSFVLLLVIWLSTAFVQIPCHEQLGRGFDSSAHRRLVRTNWLRTIAWSLRGLWVLTATLALLGKFDSR
jgi:hypothetical protein